MSFFKNLFGKEKAKEEPFTPTPSQQVSGLEPIVVQAIENLYPNIEDQKNAFDYVLKLKESGRTFRNPKLLLGLLSYSKGNIENLRASSLQNHPHFWIEEIEPIFPKMKDAEEWVKSISKSQA